MQQLELDLFNPFVPVTCRRCGFGDVVEFAGDEYYTAGYTCICDCGFSTVKPKLTYEQFAAQCDDILSRRREAIQTRARSEERKSGLKVYLSVGGWNPRRLESMHDIADNAASEQSLWNEYVHLCLQYTYYSYLYDNR